MEDMEAKSYYQSLAPSEPPRTGNDSGTPSSSKEILLSG